MEAVSARTSKRTSTENKIYARELPTILDRFKSIQVLSLDCFDTLLWRKTASPQDVFYDLQHQPTFKALQLTATLRINAETKARTLSLYRQRNGEVRLKDIYYAHSPCLTDEEISALQEEELAAEIATCYAFPPIVELIRKAHHLGLKIILVSDTYFEEPQLRRLLKHALPQDAYAMIDTIYCSCQHGKSKSNGLFKTVIESQQYLPEAILHIGDNLTADYFSAKASELQALHFLQQDISVTDILSLQAIAAKLLDPAIQTNYSLASPFHGIFALNQATQTAPETAIGYHSLGPILYVFSQFICDSLKQLELAGKKPKALFLMRDGYLPSLTAEAFMGHAVGTRVRISRFASYAASFRTIDDIDSYFLEIGKTNRFKDLTRQLLLPDKMADPIIAVANQAQKPISEFIRLIHQSEITDFIIKKSHEYCERLIRHLKNEINLTDGDTLMLVDLGYSGTTQRRLTNIFKQRNINVIGCYLIALRVPNWETTRRGVLDPSWCDDKMLQTLVCYISLFEQLCTSNESSVVDFDESGHALYSETQMESHQQGKLSLIQTECVRFIHEAKQFFDRANTTISTEPLRRSAMAELCRLMFLPTATELQFLQSFQAEMNLGTNDIMQLFDIEKGLTGLRRRGTFYMEKPSKNTRTNYPSELRAAGIEHALSLLVQHRYELNLKLNDMLPRREPLQVIFRLRNSAYPIIIEAIATYDGYFSVWIPVKLTVSIVFGKNYRWVQIESAEYIERNAFVRQDEANHTLDASQDVSYDEMIERNNTAKKGRLFECLTENAAMIIEPTIHPQTMDSVCRIVFRPIA